MNVDLEPNSLGSDLSSRNYLSLGKLLTLLCLSVFIYKMAVGVVLNRLTSVRLSELVLAHLNHMSVSNHDKY